MGWWRWRPTKEGLERNQLYALDVEPPSSGRAGLTVNTQVNTNVSSMIDAELADYRNLLAELKGLLPREPKAIEGQVL